MARRRAVDTTETQDAADRDQAENYDREERKAIQADAREAHPHSFISGGVEAKPPEAEKTSARRRVANDEGPRGGEEEIQRIQNEAVERSRSSKSVAKDDTGALAGVLAGQEVTVHWGEEIFSPQQFHTFKVGPFSATTRVIAGETFEKAAARAMEDLRRFAETERERKRTSYLRMVETTSKRG